jgi:uncharacterized OB-fold protein
MFSEFGKVGFVPATKVEGFVEHLRAGRIMGSVCRACGARAFPPRADCAVCMSSDFTFSEWSGRGVIYTWTRTVAAPAGFEGIAPYTLAVVALDDGGRAVAWLGESFREQRVEIGEAACLVPRMWEEGDSMRVLYTVERPPECE